MSDFYLQFDGVTDDVYGKIRGANILGMKLKAVENCRREGVPVILVVTVVPGVNDHQLGEIVRFAMRNLDVVRGIVFQPFAKLGRFTEARHISLAGLGKRLEEQLGFLSMYDLYPVPCPDLHCSAFTLLLVEDNRAVPLTRFLDVKTYLNSSANFNTA
ncbi:MAG: hypothetical protein ABIH76_00140 [Candidatus Bathyarchaeota archaeon]